jgi:hypothetical protein
MLLYIIEDPILDSGEDIALGGKIDSKDPVPLQ